MIETGRILDAQALFQDRRILGDRDRYKNAVDSLAKDVIRENGYWRSIVNGLNPLQTKALIDVIVEYTAIQECGRTTAEQLTPINYGDGTTVFFDPIEYVLRQRLNKVGILNSQGYLNMLPNLSGEIKAAADFDPNFNFNR